MEVSRPRPSGLTTDCLVSFPDFAPTVLNLLGIPIPGYMEGQPFLGKRTKSRKYVYGHRDRVDEVHDLARSIRDKRYLYIRNFMPHLGYNQPTAWPDLGEIRHEFYRLASSNKLTPPQKHFVSDRRPIEELYDCLADPQNLHNVANSKMAAHKQAKATLSKALFENIRETRDLGFLPETYFWDMDPKATPYGLARQGAKSGYDQPRLVQAASQVGNAQAGKLLGMLANKDPNVRYWAAVGLTASEKLSSKSRKALEKALGDPSISVCIESANALATHGHTQKSIPLLAKALSHENLAAVQHAARAIELLGAKAKAAIPRSKRLRCPDESHPTPREPPPSSSNRTRMPPCSSSFRPKPSFGMRIKGEGTVKGFLSKQGSVNIPPRDGGFREWPAGEMEKRQECRYHGITFETTGFLPASRLAQKLGRKRGVGFG